jgi:hypothetical protein
MHKVASGVVLPFSTYTESASTSPANAYEKTLSSTPVAPHTSIDAPLSHVSNSSQTTDTNAHPAATPLQRAASMPHIGGTSEKEAEEEEYENYCRFVQHPNTPHTIQPSPISHNETMRMKVDQTFYERRVHRYDPLTHFPWEATWQETCGRDRIVWSERFLTKTLAKQFLATRMQCTLQSMGATVPEEVQDFYQLHRFFNHTCASIQTTTVQYTMKLEEGAAPPPCPPSLVKTRYGKEGVPFGEDQMLPLPN